MSTKVASAPLCYRHSGAFVGRLLASAVALSVSASADSATRGRARRPVYRWGALRRGCCGVVLVVAGAVDAPLPSFGCLGADLGPHEHPLLEVRRRIAARKAVCLHCPSNC
mmetsp:Transcript_32285/g.65203  ORF Transcript_32285/g.65203 Transcript_32285/m.65203 type:complete len:111 (+) Transcript_32285:266-598(+)